jgi:hypothetical protein
MLLIVAMIAVPLTAAMQGESLNAVMENAALAALSYGPKHPTVIQLNKEIDRRLNNGERIDAEAIEQRLLELIEGRSELRRQFGARHPRTIDNAKRIHAIAGLLISAE